MAANDGRSFVKRVEAFGVIAKLRTEAVVFKLALDGLDGVLRRSPVDEGRFRASWRLSVNEVDLSVYREGGKPDTSGSKAHADGVAKLLKAKGDRTIHISNNLPYAQPLEDGSSQTQAPEGVLIPTFTELSQNLDSVINSAKKQVPDA